MPNQDNIEAVLKELAIVHQALRQFQVKLAAVDTVNGLSTMPKLQVEVEHAMQLSPGSLSGKHRRQPWALGRQIVSYLAIRQSVQVREIAQHWGQGKHNVYYAMEEIGERRKVDKDLAKLLSELEGNI